MLSGPAVIKSAHLKLKSFLNLENHSKESELMATKRSAKKASKKSAKKSAKKAAIIPPINLACIEACIKRYEDCLAKGVDRATCLKRLQKNLANCQRGIFPAN
jgi:hypothetical protein